MSEGRQAEEVKVVITGEETATSEFAQIVAGVDSMARNVTAATKSIERSMKGVEREAGVVADDLETAGRDGARALSRSLETGIDSVGNALHEVGDKADRAATEIEQAAAKGARSMQRSYQNAADGVEHALDKAGRAGQDIGKTSQFFTNVAKSARVAEQAVAAYNTKMENVNARMLDGAKGIGRTALYGGAAGYAGAVAIGVDAVQKSADFAQQFGYTQGAIRSNYKDEASFQQDANRLRSQAKTLGADPTNGYDSTQISAAHEALAKAGLADQTGVDKVLRATPQMLSFAAANKIGIDESATMASDIASSFEIDPKEWGGMLERLTKAADISTIDVPDIYETMKYAAPMAASLGIKDLDVETLTAVLGSKGIKGSMAGTGIQSYYSRLMNPKDVEKGPSDKAMKVYEDFTKKVVNQKTGKMVSTVEQIKLLGEATDKLNDKEKSWMMVQLFGLEQMKSGFTLAGAGAEAVASAMDAIQNNSAGINKVKEKLALDNEYGDMMALKKTISALEEQIGDGLAPVVSEAAHQLQAFLNGQGIDFNKLYTAFDKAKQKLDEINPSLGEAVQKLGAFGLDTIQVGGAVSPVATGFVKGAVATLSGNPIDGVMAFFKGISESSGKIEKLPPELQDLATAAKNAAIFLAALAVVNTASKAVEAGSKVWSVGKKVLFGKGKKGSVADGLSNAMSDMNVYAETVNVYGGGGGGDIDLPGGKGKGKVAGEVAEAVGKRSIVRTLAEEGVVGVARQALASPLAPIVLPVTLAAAGLAEANHLDNQAEQQRKEAGADTWDKLLTNQPRPAGLDPMSDRGQEISQNWSVEIRKVMDILTSSQKNLKTDQQKTDMQSLNNELISSAMTNMSRGEAHIFQGTDIENMVQHVMDAGLKDILAGRRLGDSGDEFTVDQEKSYMRIMDKLDKVASGGQDQNLKIHADPSVIRLVVESMGGQSGVRIVGQQIDAGQLEVTMGRQSRRFGGPQPMEP